MSDCELCNVCDREAMGRTALLNFLSTNQDVLSVCIDQCYSRDAAVAKAYFQVIICDTVGFLCSLTLLPPFGRVQFRGLCICALSDSSQALINFGLCFLQVLTEVYMTKELEVQPHQLLSLILCKLGDSSLVLLLSSSCWILLINLNKVSLCLVNVP